MQTAIVVMLAACSSPQQPAAVQNASQQVSTAKVVRGGSYGLTVDGMPATDGARVVAAFRESDGERGLPNLTLIVKDRRDAEVARHVVLSIAEADGMLDDAEGNNPALDDRVTRANAWLGENARGFDAMTILDPETTAHPADRRTATRGPLVVTWEPNRLRITDGAAVLVERDTPNGWVPENVTVGTNVCLRSPYLGGAAIDTARKLAVVTISTVTDSDFCLPATDQHHVIVW